MNARENALHILRFDHPERVVTALPVYPIGYYGVNHESFGGHGHNSPVGTRWTDVWGTGWHKELDGVMGFPREHPLAEPATLRTYRWPDPDDERLCAAIYRQAKAFPRDDRFLVGSHRDTLWEKSYMLVGMENMMTYFHTEPDFAREVLHRIMDFHLGTGRHYLKVGVEVVQLSDDLGTQEGPLLGPRIVDEFLMPEYRRLFRLYKERGVLVQFHSCGRIDSMLANWLDLGVDILDPVQATANDLVQVRAATQGRMALQGGVSSFVVLEGPTDRIRQEVRRRIHQLGREGGYFCGPDQGLPFPTEHVEALSRAVDECGRYPLESEMFPRPQGAKGAYW